MNNKIAIIIPHYYASNISKKAFNSLKEQTKKENIIVYLINDCSPNTDCEYQDLIQEYSQFFEIKYFKTKENSGGASIPRQIGLNNSKEKYIIFLDQDDYFYDEYVIENYINAIIKYQNQKIAEIQMKSLEGIEENNNIIYKEKEPLLEGSLYFTSFLKEYNINFNPKLNKCFEDFLFLSEIIFYKEINNYKTIYLDNYSQIKYHNAILSTITYNSNFEELNKDIMSTVIPYEVIYWNELIKFYKKFNKIPKDQKEYILNILINIYLNCDFFLKIFNFNKNIFKKDELKNYIDSLIDLINLVDKNFNLIESQLKMNSWHQCICNKNYFKINFEMFKDIFQKEIINYENCYNYTL